MKNTLKPYIAAIVISILLLGCSGISNEQGSNSTPSPTNSSRANTSENNISSSSTQGAADIQRSNSPTKFNGLLKAHFLDVGQADCTYIELPNNKNMLIDAGNNGDKNTILNYLNSQEVRKLDYVIGTHPHEDHIGSMDAIINNYGIGSIYMPKVSSNTRTFEDVLNAVKNKGLKVSVPKSGSYLVNVKNPVDNNTVQDELIVQLLAPNSSSYEDLNNYSIVVKITFRDTSMLFMGDAEDISEAEIISIGYDVKANLIRIGHHGSAYSTSENFLEDVRPQYAVISVGKGNDYGHPAQSTIDKLNARGIQIFRTDKLGTITAASDGKTITIDKKASSTKEQAHPKP